MTSGSSETETGDDQGDVSLAGSSPGETKSAIYDPNSGKLDLKRLAAWVGGIAAFVAATSVVSTRVTDWTRWWLNIESIESRMDSCEERLDQIEGSVPVVWRREDTPRDPNARLSEALPRIVQTLRDSEKERRRHDMAITRLSTIHEFGLTRSRERSVAIEARRVVRDRDAESDDSNVNAADPLSDLEDL